jgi:hypothetical protein
MSEWMDHLNREHNREVAAGKHDPECEWRDEGHHLCHCSKRQREAEGFLVPPTLTRSYPTCDNCDQEVEFDDGWVCRRCHVRWSYDVREDAPGEFTDDHGTLDPDAAVAAYRVHQEQLAAKLVSKAEVAE